MKHLAWFWVLFTCGCASALATVPVATAPTAPPASPSPPSEALTAADFWPASQPSSEPTPHTVAPPRAQRRPVPETASVRAPGVAERITFVSVMQGPRRVVYTRRRDVLPQPASGGEPVFHYGEGGGGRALPLTVLTPDGLCTTTAVRSVTASLNCGRRSGEWSGFELAGCAFPEAGPLVVFQGHEPLRVQSLLELSPARGEGAAAFRLRLHPGFDFAETTEAWPESREMQREMEAMQRAQAGLPPAPPEPPEPPRPDARLGTIRTALGLWFMDVLSGRGVPLMVTAASPLGELRQHRGSQWHTLVAGPSDIDYAYLIGTHGYSWPIVVPVRGGTWPPPRRGFGPPFGWLGPVMCDDP